ncbi:MAG: hypothetical protein LBD48_15245 [Treponema sp.]|jgi:HEAT repeat protein|nr:hypothetical protein [Treponema sp.]
MKKLFATCILVNIAVLAAAGPEEVQIYSYLYNGAATGPEQLGILQSMIERKVSGAGSFYVSALRRLISGYPNIRDSAELSAANEQAALLAAQIGVERFSSAAPYLWFLADRFPDSQVRAEALMSLGKIQAVNYLPQIINILNKLNVEPPADRAGGERIAFAAIIALEKYANSSGYLPVFFASVGWYSDRVKKQAANSLALISKNPEPFLAEIISGPDYSYAVKYTALQTAAASAMPESQKAAIALAALPGSWGASSKEAASSTLVNMRKLSLEMIGRYGTPDAAVYPLLERCYTSGVDINEKKAAIATLPHLPGGEAAGLLIKFFTALDAKQKNKTLTADDNALAREIITALGDTKQPAAIPVLNSIQKSGWDSAVKKMARAALKQIPKK